MKLIIMASGGMYLLYWQHGPTVLTRYQEVGFTGQRARWFQSK